MTFMVKADAERIVRDVLSEDHRARELFYKINDVSSISISASNGKFWESRTNRLGTFIVVARTKFPAECLIHELLHAELKINGYKQYVHAACIRPNQAVIDLLKTLDNTLQHFRMFQRFIELGYGPERFYADSDAETYGQLRVQINSPQFKLYDLPRYLGMYLQIVSPGGQGGDDIRESIRRKFIADIPSKFRNIILQCGECVSIYSKNEDLDAQEVIIKLVKAVVPNEDWWVGSSKFPNDGQFTRNEFEVS